MRSLIGKETAISTAEKVLVFMIESGVLYLCIWVCSALRALLYVWLCRTFTDSRLSAQGGVYDTDIYSIALGFGYFYRCGYRSSRCKASFYYVMTG